MTTLKIATPPKRSYMKIFVTYSAANGNAGAPMPNVMARQTCSCCGVPVKIEGIDLQRRKVVRSAVDMPCFILEVYLCDDCAEKRQQWCEEKTGIKRGTSVDVFNGMEYHNRTIDYYSDDRTGVDPDGYCVNVGYPGETLAGKPRVRRVQQSLF